MPSSQEWQRSPVGITPIVVRPRAGCRIVTKKDSEWSNNDQATSSEIKIPNRAATDELSVSVRGESEKSRQTAQLGRVCSVCTRATASYSCPRCLIAYCSSKCYKVRNHHLSQEVGCSFQSPAQKFTTVHMMEQTGLHRILPWMNVRLDLPSFDLRTHMSILIRMVMLVE